MKTKLFAVALLAGGALFAQPRVQAGIGIGGYGPSAYAPPYAQQVMPPCPGPDYSWVDGYWSAAGVHRKWVAGFWARRTHDSYRDDRHDNRRQSFCNGGERDEHRGGTYGRDSWQGNSFRDRGR